MESHMCVGTGCWICGEPDEVRYMREAIRSAFFDQCKSVLTSEECHKLSRVASQAIRENVIVLMTAAVEAETKLYQAQNAITLVEFDPNIRLRSNETYVTVDDVYGPIAVGQQVKVFGGDPRVQGGGWVTRIDEEDRLVYVKVVWSLLEPYEVKA